MSSLRSWLGFSKPFDFSKALGLGTGVGVLLILLVGSLFSLAVLAAFKVLGTSLFGELPNGSGASFGLTGIIVAMIGAPFVIWRTLVAQKQAEVAEHGMITERIMNAVEGLGYEKTIKDKLGERTVPNLEVRIGAIYSLERIAQDSIRDHVRIMEILCVYIRENAPASLSEKCPEKPYARQIIGETPVRKWAQELKKPRVDVQVALDIIGRRTDQQISQERDVRTKTNTIGYRLDIRRTCLTGLRSIRWELR